MNIANTPTPPPIPDNETIANFIAIALHDNGFRYLNCPGHLLSKKTSSKVYLGRYIASCMVSRWLTSRDVVRYRDGNPANLYPENLEVVTQQEHLLRNRIAHPNNSPQKVELICPVCGDAYEESPSHAMRRVTCSTKCAGLLRRKFNLNVLHLRILVWSMPATELALALGVSDRAIGKRCQRLGIPVPGRGNWQRYQNGHISPEEWFKMMCEGLRGDEIAQLSGEG